MDGRPALRQRLLHPLCLVGGVIAAAGFGASTIGLAVDLVREERTAYQGLLIFVLFPAVGFFGLALVGAGLWLERRRERRLRERAEPWTPRIDLSSRRHRRILAVFSAGTALFLLLSIVGAYHTYEFTESREFCGELCHEPMEPQYIAHQNSPHAEVPCSHCHVGEGVTGYIEAKVSGLRQLWQMITESYPRPIHARKDALLIAGGSCGHCHSAGQLRAGRLDNRVRFGYDLFNTERRLRFLLVPHGDTMRTVVPGSHWHAGLRIRFRSAGEADEEIPWVEVERPGGEVAVYTDAQWEGSPPADWQPPRAMVCVDCHSRPAHQFHTPDHMVNEAIALGRIDRSLPYIKKVGVEALSKRYATRAEADAGIARYVLGFYEANFEGRVLARKAALDAAIAELQRIHRLNVFPEMRTDWSVYPDNIGHRTSRGCFRCHSGRHRNEKGEVLDHRCETCHVFFEKAAGGSSLMEIPADGSALHPFDVKSHADVECRTCHTGTATPYRDCTRCHADAGKGEVMKFECSLCHKPGKPREAKLTCGPCHPAGDSPMHLQKGHGDCLSCHTPHTWGVAKESCSAAGCHPDAASDYYDMHREAFGGVLSHLAGLPAAGR